MTTKTKTKTKTKRPRGRSQKSGPVPTTFTYEVYVTIPGGYRDERGDPNLLFQAINMLHVGNVNCNVRNEAGVLVTRPGVTKVQEAQLLEAHYAAHRSLGLRLKVTRDLMSGEVIDIQVPALRI